MNVDMKVDMKKKDDRPVLCCGNHVQSVRRT